MEGKDSKLRSSPKIVTKILRIQGVKNSRAK